MPAKLTEYFIAWTVEPDPARQHHPETIHPGMRMQIIIAAFLQHLNGAADDISLAQRHDRLTRFLMFRFGEGKLLCCTRRCSLGARGLTVRFRSNISHGEVPYGEIKSRL